MRSFRFLLAVLSLIALAPAAAPAADDPRSSLLVSPGWLATHLKDPDLVLLHVGDRKEYDAGHIPGARYVTLSDISISDHTGKGLMLEMPPAEDLRERLQKLGISDSSQVIVYYGNDWISPTTRVLFTLDYAGLGDRASLLDGGQPGWVRAGHAVETSVAAEKRGQLSALSTKPIVVDAAFVREHRGKPGYALVDGRSASFYDGVDVGDSHGQSHKTGHIAGAGSFPFTELVGDDMNVRPAKDFAELFSKAGVKPGDTVIGYCHIGQQATAMLFAARTLGYKVVLYDGSFEDWSRQEDAPVEAAKGKS